ncbi:malto-oligosyltrehalose trehalohydrolase [Puniceibacterium antarcticum]|nr:malto-oligosyltrehalose trehalohydrolase [Puniceibacterium antarcticum]
MTHEHAIQAGAWGTTFLGGTTWAVSLWAPSAKTVSVEVKGQETPLPLRDGGLFAGTFTGGPGDPYALIVDGQSQTDPAARALADDATGSALLCLPVYRRIAAPRPDWAATVLLEIHIGTFTAEGTFAAAATRMAALAELGITAIEIMPVAAFPGQRGWGYDGVFPYAVHPAYGSPQDLSDMVDAIHEAGMLAILDVVYNHFGPLGGSLDAIAPEFFDPDRTTPWGPGIDYTRAPVRRFFIDNAVMWVRDFGFDGLRLDAVHEIRDESDPHMLDQLAHAVRAAVPDRPVHLIAEDDRNLPHMRDRGSITACWNDDYHHSMHCLLTGEDESYYASFAVDPLSDLLRALAEGHVEQGQPRPTRDTPRGEPTAHLPPQAFVNSNQTHDQVGNRAQGERLIQLADPEAVRIAHAMLLSAPAVPMLFMGEEEGARAPFLFFADFDGELGEAVRKGRAAEFAGFSQFGGDVPDPLAPETFAASRPYATPAPDADEWRALTRQCLTWRAASLAPLLISGKSDTPQVRATGCASLYGVWPFEAGRLEMVAHLGAVPDDAVSLDAPDLVLGQVSDPCHFAVKVTPR